LKLNKKHNVSIISNLHNDGQYAISSLIIFHSLVFRGQPRPKPINKGAL